MIVRISDADEARTLADTLCDSHYSRRIRSDLRAYSTKYDFSRFYALYENESAVCMIHLFNSTAVVSNFKDRGPTIEEICEIAEFLRFCSPVSIELSPENAPGLAAHIGDGYRAEDRFEFKYSGGGTVDTETESSPALDDVFAVLKECFPSLSDDRGLWLVDTSHRVRRGLTRLCLYKKCAALTVSYMIDGAALISQVAVKEDCRSRGFARRLIWSVSETLLGEGFEIRLFSGKERAGFYDEIGFELIGRDMIFEREEK